MIVIECPCGDPRAGGRRKVRRKAARLRLILKLDLIASPAREIIVLYLDVAVPTIFFAGYLLCALPVGKP